MVLASCMQTDCRVCSSITVKLSLTCFSLHRVSAALQSEVIPSPHDQQQHRVSTSLILDARIHSCGGVEVWSCVARPKDSFPWRYCMETGSNRYCCRDSCRLYVTSEVIGNYCLSPPYRLAQWHKWFLPRPLTSTKRQELTWHLSPICSPHIKQWC